MAKKLFTSPRGVFQFPRLSGKPDTKFNKAGVWKVALALPADVSETTEFLEQIETWREEAFQKFLAEAPKDKKRSIKKSPDCPFRSELDADGEETGAILVNFKMYASGTDKKGEKFTMRPVLFDKSGKPITDDIRIGGGTEGRISFEPHPYYAANSGAGVTLRLRGAQIIKLVEFGGNASYFGFGDESTGDEGESAGAATAEKGEASEDDASEDY